MPLLRREDNSGQAVVGEPLSPDRNSPISKVASNVDSPTDSPLAIRALAGPMSPKQVRNENHTKSSRVVASWEGEQNGQIPSTCLTPNPRFCHTQYSTAIRTMV